MAMKPFHGADPADIVKALQRDCSAEQVISLLFRAETYPVRSLDERDQWMRVQGIIGCSQVYEAFGIKSLPVEPPAPFYYATGLETIGTIANVLMHGGVHRKFVSDCDSALATARAFLDQALRCEYQGVEAYSCRQAWCDWFIGDGILDETVLLGSSGDWWLLAVTGTD